MSGASHRPTPSYCDDVSWSESSHTTSTQNSIDSLIWSIDNPFQEDIYIPREYRSSFVDPKIVGTRIDESVESLKSTDTTCMSVSLDAEMCALPAILPVKAGHKFMSYKTEAIQILLSSESCLSSTQEGTNFIKRVHSNSKLSGFRLDNVGWMFDTAQHLMQSEERTRKCCFYDVFQLAVALYDRYLSILFADQREELFSFKVPAATCLCIASGVLSDTPFSPEELAETAMLSTIHIIHEEFKVAKKLGWEYSKLSTPMEFIEYIIPVLEIEIVLRKRLLSLSSLKSCFCLYGPEFLDIPYSVIGFSCILHTADTKPFKKYANHIRETCFRLLLHSDTQNTQDCTSKSISDAIVMKQIETAYTLLEISTNEIVNSN